MNKKLQTLYEKLCTLVNESPAKESDQAGGPGLVIETPEFDLSLLDPSAP